VDLLVRPNQDGRTAHVRGQALSLAGRTLGAGTVEATPTPSGNPDMPPSVSSKLEASGEFAFANVARGRYDVLLRLGSRAIELYDVEV
jgi:hypothetical protein